MSAEGASHKPIKVLVFFASNDIGGPGKGLFQLIKYAGARNISFTVCNFKHPKQKTFQFLEYARRHDVDIRLITQRRPLDLKMIGKALEIARADDYDVVQSHDYKTHLLAWITSRRLNIPWLALSHGWTSENFKIRIYSFLQRRLMRLSDSLIAVSPMLFREAQRIRKSGRTVQILNAIERPDDADPIERQATRERLGVAADCTLLGVFGRLSYEKGQDQFIEAFSLLPDKRKVKAIFVGSGPDQELLQTKINDAGLAEHIQLLGYQEELRQYYSAVDLTVLPSRNEGLPNVILESQAMGRAVIAFDVGGVGEAIVNGKNGWLVKSGDIAEMARCIRSAMEDPDGREQLAANASKMLYPKFSPEARCEKFAVEYRRLIAAR